MLSVPATSGTPAAYRRPKSCVMRCQEARYISSLPPLTSVELLRKLRCVAKGMWSATAAIDGSMSPGFWL